MAEYQFAVVLTIQADNLDEAQALIRNFNDLDDEQAARVSARAMLEGDYETDNLGQRVLYLPPLPGVSGEEAEEDEAVSESHTD